MNDKETLHQKEPINAHIHTSSSKTIRKGNSIRLSNNQNGMVNFRELNNNGIENTPTSENIQLEKHRILISGSPRNNYEDDMKFDSSKKLDFRHISINRNKAVFNEKKEEKINYFKKITPCLEGVRYDYFKKSDKNKSLIKNNGGLNKEEFHGDNIAQKSNLIKGRPLEKNKLTKSAAESQELTSSQISRQLDSTDINLVDTPCWNSESSQIGCSSRTISLMNYDRELNNNNGSIELELSTTKECLQEIRDLYIKKVTELKSIIIEQRNEIGNLNKTILLYQSLNNESESSFNEKQLYHENQRMKQLVIRLHREKENEIKNNSLRQIEMQKKSEFQIVQLQNELERVSRENKSLIEKLSTFAGLQTDYQKLKEDNQYYKSQLQILSKKILCFSNSPNKRHPRNSCHPSYEEDHQEISIEQNTQSPIQLYQLADLSSIQTNTIDTSHNVNAEEEDEQLLTTIIEESGENFQSLSNARIVMSPGNKMLTKSNYALHGESFEKEFKNMQNYDETEMQDLTNDQPILTNSIAQGTIDYNTKY